MQLQENCLDSTLLKQSIDRLVFRMLRGLRCTFMKSALRLVATLEAPTSIGFSGWPEHLHIGCQIKLAYIPTTDIARLTCSVSIPILG